MTKGTFNFKACACSYYNFETQQCESVYWLHRLPMLCPKATHYNCEAAVGSPEFNCK